MDPKKRDLKIICNLQWKNKYVNGGSPTSSSIVCLYDVPTTTLNWETFKSYLLKNSGTPGDDVLVSYVDQNDKEFCIKNQIDFQLALYTFRTKARNNEIINLKLDRISERNKVTHVLIDSHSQTNDSKMDINYENPPEWFKTYMIQFKKEFLSDITKTFANYISVEKPTEHHRSNHGYSKKLRADYKILRHNDHKRRHKHLFAAINLNDKELTKSMKIEKKLEKLESKSKKLKEKQLAISKPLESNPEPCKGKWLCLLQEISQMNAAPVRCQKVDVPHMIGGEVYLHSWDVINNGRLPWTADTELRFTWGSAMLNPVNKTVPCPLLKPGETGVISVLLDIPKKLGLYESYWYFHHKNRKFGHWLGCRIYVDGVNRVEPLANLGVKTYSPCKKKYSPEDKKDHVKNGIEEVVLRKKASIKNDMENVVPYSDAKEISDGVKNLNIENDINKKSYYVPKLSDIAADELENRNFHSYKFVEDRLHEYLTYSAQNSYFNKSPIYSTEKILYDEQSKPLNLTIEQKCSDETDLKCNVESWDEFLIGANKNMKNKEDTFSESSLCMSESIGKLDEDVSSGFSMNDMVLVDFAEENEENSKDEFAYVIVDGSKIPVPKRFLRSDYLETAEDAPDPHKIIKIENNEEQEITGHTLIQTDSGINDLSVAEETSAKVNKLSKEIYSKDPKNEEKNSEVSRVFVFPQNYSGYELFGQFNPSDNMNGEWNIIDIQDPVFSSNQPTHSQSTVSPTMQNVSHISENSGSASLEHVQNFQQTPPEERRQPLNDEVFRAQEALDHIQLVNANILTENQNIETQPAEHIQNFQQASFVNQAVNEEAFGVQEAIEQTQELPSNTTTENRNKETTSSEVENPINSVVSKAVSIASSAFNTANDVFNRIIPQQSEPEVWIGGQWITTNTASKRELNLTKLYEMGFLDRNLNASLLARYNDDMTRVIADLI